MNAWITPDEASDQTRLIEIRVPDDAYLYGCILGAVYLLTLPENWEAIGTITAAEAAALFSPTFEDLVANAE